MAYADDRVKTFRQLHADPGCFIIPNPWDAGSARILELLGFKALATTSAGLAFSLAKADGCNAVPRDAALANAVRIIGATGLPVAADLENGYGAAPEACAETIRQAIAIGLSGGSIEDSTGEDGEAIFDIGAATDRVRAAVEAARGSGRDFVLTARAENFLHGRRDLHDTITRLQAYQEAGADVLFAPGLRTADEIRAVTSSVDRPVNVIMGLKDVHFSVSELAELGVKRISVGSSLARAAIGAFMTAAREMADSGTFTFGDSAMPHADVNRLFMPKH
jgi:2-methylisocitrate lyase-like PEP mutase family enzyme